MFVERPVPGLRPGPPARRLAHRPVLPIRPAVAVSGHLDQGAGQGLALVPGALPDKVLVGRVGRNVLQVSSEDFHILEHLWSSVLYSEDPGVVHPDSVVHLRGQSQ